MTKIRVLIIDDSPFIHRTIARALDTENDKFEICGSAKDGREGVDQFLATGPDAVIMDITMPVMDGLSASREIFSINPDANIIILSSMGDDEIIAEANNLGIREYIQKPFNASELIAAILKSIEKE